ncbi:MAG: PilZ domain-containing protein [Pseudomonadota bacterium]
MKKRNCNRFNIPGTTLYYKIKPSFFKKPDYTDDYFPVINLSLGGAQFLCNERLKAGESLIIKVNIPGQDKKLEILAGVKWISKNREQSYQYQTGIAFNSYGEKKDENPKEILSILETLEQGAGIHR